MKNTLKYLGIIIILFIFGFIIQDYFFKISLYQVATENVSIPSKSLSEQLFSRFIFVLSISSIPLLYLIVKYITKFNFIYKGLVSCGIIIGCGILTWQLRVFQQYYQIQNLTKYKIGIEAKMLIDNDTLIFEWYLFLGFIIGTTVSILIFKNKK